MIYLTAQSFRMALEARLRFPVPCNDHMIRS